MPALRKNCRVEYVNKYTLLIDYSSGIDTIVYYELGFKKLKDIYSTYKYRIDNEMTIDLFAFYWLPYPMA